MSSADAPEMALGPWLEAHLSGVPEALAAAVRAQAAQSGSTGPEAMISAALDGLETVAAGTGDRPGALGLLAADALLTYAFEAAADPRVGGSAASAVRLARWAGPTGEIGGRLDVQGKGDS